MPSASSLTTHVTSASARAAQDVDEAFDLFERDAVTLGEVALGHLGPDEALLGDELGVAERVGEKLEVREPVLLEQGAAQPRDRQVEAARARAPCSNTAGVVVSYWNRPVSQTSAAYRHTAASRVSGRPSMRSSR